MGASRHSTERESTQYRVINRRKRTKCCHHDRQLQCQRQKYQKSFESLTAKPLETKQLPTLIGCRSVSTPRAHLGWTPTGEDHNKSERPRGACEPKLSLSTITSRCENAADYESTQLTASSVGGQYKVTNGLSHQNRRVHLVVQLDMRLACAPRAIKMRTAF